MIVLTNTRFGDLTLPRDAEVYFPHGLIGFSAETRFAIVERERGRIAYLQSLRTPHLALPVLDASLLHPTYSVDEAARFALDIGGEPADLLVLVVVCVAPEDGTLLANLLAPLVIDAKSRRGAQIILDAERYGARVAIGAPPNADARLAG